jgi:NADPH-dependent F420 reductase
LADEGDGFVQVKTIAVIGGTGDLGRGLARRFARAGFDVIVGSRRAARAAEAASALQSGSGGMVRGLDNVDAAEAGDLVVVAVPFANQAATLREIAPAVAGKIVVDATVPLVPPRVARVQLPASGSAAAIAAQALDGAARLVTAFHNVSAQKLRGDGPVPCDILVFGDDVEARDAVIGVIARIGLRGLHGGPLANAVAAEAMTSVLISINRRYGVAEGAGIRITGIPGEDA